MNSRQVAASVCSLEHERDAANTERKSECFHPKLITKFDCTREVSTADIDYKVVCAVITSWDRKILQLPDWSRFVGDRLLRHIFRVDPKTTSLFGFPPETQWDDPSLSENEDFARRAIRLVKAIDTTIVFLGPDLEPLKEELFRLGWQHTAMKALPSHWPIVGEALLSSLEDCMIGGISNDEREAWIMVRDANDQLFHRPLIPALSDGHLWLIDRSTALWDFI